jgi:hypothetical protein
MNPFEKFENTTKLILCLKLTVLCTFLLTIDLFCFVARILVILGCFLVRHSNRTRTRFRRDQTQTIRFLRRIVNQFQHQDRVRCNIEWPGNCFHHPELYGVQTNFRDGK